MTKKFQSPTTGITYDPRDFHNCRSSGIVYMASCSCPLIYVGKTIREFRRRILEHIGDIEHARDTPVALHMRRVHPDSPFSIRFCVIESIRSNGRKGDIDKLLQQKESTWIYRLKSLSPRGLNDILSFKPFFVNFD